MYSVAAAPRATIEQRGALEAARPVGTGALDERAEVTEVVLAVGQRAVHLLWLWFG